MTVIAPENVLAAQWSTAFVDSLPDSSFAYVKAGVRKLPYKDAGGKVDMPHVRNALARLASTDIPDGEKPEVKTKLQGALKNITASDDVSLRTTHVILADDSSTTLPTEMMLLRSGTFYTQKYGEVPLTTSDLHEMDTNFKAGIGMAGDGSTGIPVDFAHQSHLNAGAWIKDMEARDTSDGETELWATNIEFSDSGKQAILGKEYKMLSSDFYPRAFGMWADAESGVTAQNVIVGAAFTNRPMFSGNQPVTASETDTNTDAEGGTKTVIYINASQKNKEKSMNIDELRVKAADDLTGPEQRFLQANAEKLSEAEKTKFEIIASTTEAPKVVKAADVTGTEGTVAIEASELKAIKDNQTSLEASVKAASDKLDANEKAAIKEQVIAHAARGAIKADRVDSWTNMIFAADEKGREGLLADLGAAASDPVLAKEQGSTQGADGAVESARDQLMKKATEIVKASDGKTTIQDAMEAAKTANPELVEASGLEQENKGGFQASDAEFKAAGVNRG